MSYIEDNANLPEIAATVQVATYIEENPVRAGMVEKSGDYPYTGYGAAKRGNSSALTGIGKLYNCSPQEALTAISGMLSHIHFKQKDPNLVKSPVLSNYYFKAISATQDKSAPKN